MTNETSVSTIITRYNIVYLYIIIKNKKSPIFFVINIIILQYNEIFNYYCIRVMQHIA
jgi:hypothetical protein